MRTRRSLPLPRLQEDLLTARRIIPGPEPFRLDGLYNGILSMSSAAVSSTILLSPPFQWRGICTTVGTNSPRSLLFHPVLHSRETLQVQSGMGQCRRRSYRCTSFTSHLYTMMHHLFYPGRRPDERYPDTKPQVARPHPAPNRPFPVQPAPSHALVGAQAASIVHRLLLLR